MTQTLTFEECKRKLLAAEKAKSQAESTVIVVGKQMETLKAKRRKSEEECVENHGVKIDELPAKLEELRAEYISKVEQIEQELAALNNQE